VFDVGVAHGADEDVRVLGSFDGVEEVVLAGVLFAVAEDDDDLAALADFGELFGDGEVDGVVEGGTEDALFGVGGGGGGGAQLGKLAVAFVEVVDAGGEGCGGVGEVADEAQVVAEADGEGLILRLQDLLEKGFDVLLVLLDEFGMAAADVDDEAYADGEPGGGGEEADLQPDAVLNDFEVFKGEVLDDAALRIMDADGGVDEVGFDFECGDLRVQGWDAEDDEGESYDEALGGSLRLMRERCGGGSGGGVENDLREGDGVEAGSAYECTVDVFEAAEGLGVVGFDGAAVEDAGGGGERRGEGFGDLGADELVGFGGDLRGGGAAGADGPDGLVGEDDGSGGGGVDAFKGYGGLQL